MSAPISTPTKLSKRDLLISAALMGLGMAYFSLSWGHTLDLRDEGYLLNRSWLVAQGQLPHRDFVDVYGPLGLLVSGKVLGAFDGEILSVRVLVGAVKAVAVGVTFLIVRIFTPTSYAMLGALLSMAFWGRLSANLNTPYASLFTIVLCMVATLCVMLALERRSRLAFASAGVAVGLAVLGKQSLGIMTFYGLALALVGVGLLEDDEQPATPVLANSSVAVFWLGGLAAILPVARFLGWGDYALHFFLLHVFMLLVGITALRRRRLGSPVPQLATRMLPFGLAAAVVVAVALLPYAIWGRLDQLVFDMFVLPSSYQNYYQAVSTPPLSLVVVIAGGLAMVQACLVALRGNRRLALAWFGAGLVLTVVGRFMIPFVGPGLYDLDRLAFIHHRIEGVEAPLLLAGAILLVLRDLRRPVDEPVARRAIVMLPLLFANFMLAYQVFPRAGQNLWTIHGAMVPLLVVVAHGWARPSGFPPSARLRRLMACVVAMALPLWIVSPLVAGVVLPPDVPRRSLELPKTAGISLTPHQIRVLRIDDAERLVERLAGIAPIDAPLFMLSNQEMIRYVSGRPHLFPDQEFYLFLAGWGLLPASLESELDTEEMLETLRTSPDAILVTRPDATAANLAAALPRISEHVNRHYRVTEEVGQYRIIRRRSPAEP